MAEKLHTAEVILPFALDSTYTFLLPPGAAAQDLPGKRVIVPFGKGNKLYTGIVASRATSEIAGDLKMIADIPDEKPLVGEKSLSFWKWMADYYMCSTGEVMNAALPAALNVSGETRFALNETAAIDFSALKPTSRRIVNALEGKGECDLRDIISGTGISNAAHHISNLVKEGIVLMREDVKRSTGNKNRTYLSLSPSILNGKDLEEVILSLKKSPGQLKVLMTVIELMNWDGEEGGNLAVDMSALLKKSASNRQVVNALVKKGILVMVPEEVFKSRSQQVSELHKLTVLQEDCLESIRSQFAEKDVVLLRGVTSSGKTEIYAHLISELIAGGRQVLYLLPEIALTTQLVSRLRAFFGDGISIYHSRLSQGEKLRVWQDISAPAAGRIRIILGARSSIFLPFADLGLIIVDEEHDRSFKQQDPAPRYMARDSAIVLAGIHGGKVLLGSACPSLESLENCRTGKYGYTEITARYGGFEMPEVKAIDLSDAQKKRRMKGPLSLALIAEIAKCLEAGEQVILFQNRRGYAPLLLCNNCGHTPKCVNCDLSLTYHKSSRQLLCHYCGHREEWPEVCGECRSGAYSELGTGTEKVEEYLSDIFPSASLARFDLDSTRKKNSFQNLIDRFESRSIDILIGTQMVTKGLDFANVGLVGIVNADSLMKFPDFRSFERSFQMLTQVAGRAGRKDKRGRVMVQAYDVAHPVIRFFLDSDYEAFSKSEMEQRKEFSYPPFFRITELRLKHRDRQILTGAGKALGDVLRSQFGKNLLGPAFPYIARIRNQYSLHFILRTGRSDSVSAVRKKLRQILSEFSLHSGYKSVRVFADVDPY